MSKYRGPQLSLIPAFEKTEARELRLVEALLEEIKCVKYYRINTRFSDIKTKDRIESALNTILFQLASLVYRQAKYLDGYRDKPADHYYELTREKSHLNVTDVLSEETLAEYYLKGESRLKTISMAYRDLLHDNREWIDGALKIYKQIHRMYDDSTRD
jgi:hypothetical protein